MNKRRELESLEVEASQAVMNQRGIAGHAHIRERRLEHYHDLIKEMLISNTAELVDEATLQIIIDNIRKKINDVNI